MTVAVLAQGSTITFNSSPIGEVTNADFAVDTDQLEVTNHDSPDGYREYIAGLKTPQEVPMTVNLDPTLHETLLGLTGDSSNPASLVLETPNGMTFTVDAWLKGFNAHAPATGAALTADLTFQTTGPMLVSGS